MPANDCVDELLLASLRILYLERHDFDVRIFGSLLCHERDGVGLVVLYADISFVYADCLHQQSHAYEYLLGAFEHETMVGGEVWLTLYGIDYDALCFLSRWRT